jgi:hypothetical protein
MVMFGFLFMLVLVYSIFEFFAPASATGITDSTANNHHPLEKGDPCLFNSLKRMDSSWILRDFCGLTSQLPCPCCG